MKLFVFLSLLSLAPLQAAAPILINGIAVVVGDAIITYKDVELAIADDLDSLERRYASQPQLFEQKATEMRREKLTEMVENQLVLQEFKRAGYVVPESFIQSRINEDIRKYGDRLTLTKTLQAQGVTFETYRNRIRERTILELMWRQKVPHDPLISPAKIENYYVQNRDKFKMEDQVKLRMIVLTNSPNDIGYSPMKMAREIIGKLDQKVPFEELAKIYSQGSQAAQGGDWGWAEKSVLRKELWESASKLEPGQHSQPIETRDAIYILKLEEKKLAYTKSLSEVRDEIESTLKAQEIKRLRKQWVDQLKNKSFVSYF